GTVAALGLSSRHMPYKGLIMAVLISPMIVPLIISGVAIFFFMAKAGLAATHKYCNRISRNYCWINSSWRWM
ncbi:hypothetical protein OAX99_01530, partial [Candidatus Pelagibacter sp.]|nr:hypothetical protein [Candidatus Pelagibacter sp.]